MTAAANIYAGPSSDEPTIGETLGPPPDCHRVFCRLQVAFSVYKGVCTKNSIMLDMMLSVKTTVKAAVGNFEGNINNFLFSICKNVIIPEVKVGRYSPALRTRRFSGGTQFWEEWKGAACQNSHSKPVIVTLLARKHVC